jgi:hypothetical protein
MTIGENWGVSICWFLELLTIGHIVTNVMHITLIYEAMPFRAFRALMRATWTTW